MEVIDIQAVKDCLEEVSDCEDKQYALALLEWAIGKRTFDLEEHDKQVRADAISECLQIVQKIKDDYNDAKFGEEIPINYGTLCGIIIAFERLLKGADNEI